MELRIKEMDQLKSLMICYFWEDKIVKKYFNINTTKTLQFQFSFYRYDNSEKKMHT